ncbi:MAG: hypothetical protein GAK30_00869 [Paracidovorax wautersii]|uniref:Branched-chain amino acid transport protein n=1 Tax=Paracidovorax wautersii TaxID=1177982 RepID=A0A7V8FR30_9BURK|nr:MAG: hypothetical protein GAK30_00869 [Paracidovorax wautersii]
MKAFLEQATSLGWYPWLAVAALVASTVLARAAFLLSARDWRLPPWLQQGLRHAPLATLMAIVAPAVWQSDTMAGPGLDARWLALAVCAGWFFGVRRSVTGAMLMGALAYLAARMLG